MTARDDDVIEVMARAAAGCSGIDWDAPSTASNHSRRQAYRREARAQIAALHAAGLQVVRAECRQALLRIAFQEGVNSLVGDPEKWPSTIAYRALGGRIEGGQRIDSRETLDANEKETP